MALKTFTKSSKHVYVFWTVSWEPKICYPFASHTNSKTSKRSSYVLFTLFVFVCVWWGPTHIVFLFYFSSSMLPVSPDRPFLNGPSVYSNVHLSIGTVTICVCKSIERIINDGLVWFPESNGLLFESIYLCCFPYHIPIL